MCTQGVSLLEIIYHLSKLNEQKRLSSTHLSCHSRDCSAFYSLRRRHKHKNAASRKISVVLCLLLLLVPIQVSTTASANDPPINLNLCCKNVFGNEDLIENRITLFVMKIQSSTALLYDGNSKQ